MGVGGGERCLAGADFQSSAVPRLLYDGKERASLALGDAQRAPELCFEPAGARIAWRYFVLDLLVGQVCDSCDEAFSGGETGPFAAPSGGGAGDDLPRILRAGSLPAGGCAANDEGEDVCVVARPARGADVRCSAHGVSEHRQQVHQHPPPL